MRFRFTGRGRVLRLAHQQDQQKDRTPRRPETPKKPQVTPGAIGVDVLRRRKRA